MAGNALSRAVKEAIASDPEAHYPGDPLVRWFEKAQDRDLWRINVYEVSGQLTADRSRLLATFIRLARDGVLDINWDFHCTECNAVAGTHRHLSDATAGDHCPLCNLDFRNTLDANVEVTFTPAARLYSLNKRFLAEQTRRIVEAHGNKAIRLPVLFVSGMDCLHVPLFREIFETETLSLRESLRVGQVCIMFTDIKGSTELYDRLGDSRAYALIRDHFDILFRRVEQNGGVIVKTIGDSVMASFEKPVDGVTAALAIQKAFAEFNRRGEAVRDEILVKIGLHAGSTIMVNLNNRLDYFGQVVNMAARIQGTAGGGAIVVSAAVRKDAAAGERLSRHQASITRRMESLKGISGEQEVYSLQAAAS
jgi:class 3 adenylate cyclase